MIYELLLIQEEGMFIPSDIFARRDYRRTGSIPYECVSCGLVFLSQYGCVRHSAKHHTYVFSDFHRPARLLLPEVSVSLLQTCRFIRLEASPVLYSRNSFHFSDPATASNFRWATDCTQAGAIQEMGIKLQFFNQFTPWTTYFTKRTLSLGQDFPRLKRMIFDLNVWFVVETVTLLRSMSERLRERSQALEWVLVLTLSSEQLIDCFEPLVDREDNSKHGKKEVLRHVWPNENGGPGKNALLWWGSPGEAVPHKHRLIGK